MCARLGRSLLIQLLLVSCASGNGLAGSNSTDTSIRPVVKPACEDEKNNYVPGQLLVKFRSETSLVQAAALIEARGGAVVKHIMQQRIFLISFPPTWCIDRAMAEFQAVPEIEWAEPNYIRRTHRDTAPDAPVSAPQ